MIRVGFIFQESILCWNGGLNYYRNILEILLDSKQYIPVIFTPISIQNAVKEKFNTANAIEVIGVKFLTLSTINGLLQRFFMYIFGYDLFLENTLKNNTIDILSHSTTYFLNKRASIPSCCWIPDLQILHFANFFSKKDLFVMERCFKILGHNSKRIIVSSSDCKKDLLSIVKVDESKINILQFVVKAANISENQIKETQKKYKLENDKYFITTNQFWKHKNHSIIVETLLVLKQNKDIPFKIIATGALKEPRDSQYVESLLSYIKRNELDEYFITTGSIPYFDLIALLHGSLAVIQPSLFEGWNTSVEECKSIGKKIILSDIPVHREQNPDNAIFFDPYSAKNLAGILSAVFEGYDDNLESKMYWAAQKDFPNRWKQFSDNYLRILSSTLEGQEV